MQAARKLELRKGLQAPRTDAPPLEEVSHAEFQAAKREEQKNLKRAARVKKAGKKKPYLQEGDNCPTLAKIKGDATKSQRAGDSRGLPWKYVDFHGGSSILFDMFTRGWSFI